MTKNELIMAIAEETENTKAGVTPIVDTLFEKIKNTLATGEKVFVSDFGTFERKDRVERNGVNPSTGEKIVIPESKAIKFKSAKSFKEEINE